MTDCRCSRPTRDDRFLCDTCTTTLEKLIAELPWLDTELDTTITRTKGIDYRALGGTTGGKKPVERPLPGNLGAGRARDHLKAVLVSWVRFLDAERIGPHKPLPADTITAISAWMLGRVDNAWRYMCGVIWRKVEQMNEGAKSVLETGSPNGS